ncbi:MAG TPA: ABC transporter substrate-binding protein [Negativicutes bacterium]|nr:ABC transporter substrate-binding protein [Negativicutes bacterium]
MNKFPTFSQWKQIFKVLEKTEQAALLAFFALFIGSLAFLGISFYTGSTKAAPALGGTYTEGIVGQPRFINPIYGETNDIDRTFIDLLFSGLMKHDNQGGITTDLAETYHISPDGKTYEFQLKDNVFWHDGRPLTADDIVFTITTLQSAEYKSPLRANWLDVVVEKISDKSVSFKLKSAYNAFLENATVKIIPKHIFENISPENFTLSSYNLQPVGSGPFQFESISQINTGFIKSLDLTSNRKYYGQPSFISRLSFEFFEKKEDLVKAANEGKIQGFTLAALENNQAAAQKQISQGWLKNTRFSVYSFSLPRYFAVFFNNQKSSLFADVNIRKALSYATDKDSIIEEINRQTNGSVNRVDSPILPAFFNYPQASYPYDFNPEQAGTLLDKAGFKDNGQGKREKAITKKPAFQFTAYLKIGSKGSEVIQLQACLARLDESFKTLLASETDGTYGKGTENAVTEFQKKYLPDLNPTGETGVSTRKKMNELCQPVSANSEPLAFSLVTINQPQLLHIANALKQHWEQAGASIEIKAVSATEIKTIIKNRSYDALLYGEALGAEPDLYPFWHSSQKLDPGLNLSAYENKDVDKLLKEARETLDKSVKEQKYIKLADTIINDAPALFLYNPDYIYWISDTVQGIDTTKIIDPAKRFSNITNWFIKTKRVWK